MPASLSRLALTVPRTSVIASCNWNHSAICYARAFLRTLNLNSKWYLPLNYHESLSWQIFYIFIIQTMYSIVAHENEFQLLFQKFAFATDIAIPI